MKLKPKQTKTPQQTNKISKNKSRPDLHRTELFLCNRFGFGVPRNKPMVHPSLDFLNALSRLDTICLSQNKRPISSLATQPTFFCAYSPQETAAHLYAKDVFGSIHCSDGKLRTISTLNSCTLT